ncbi:12881_t:CDS:2, partial [Dentiscutata heterogama]
KWLFIEEIIPVLGPFAKTIKRLERSQYLAISYVYLYNNNQDELKNKLQIKDDAEDKPKVKQKIKINRLVNMFRLIDMIEDKLYQAVNDYYKDLKLDDLVASLLDSH